MKSMVNKYIFYFILALVSIFSVYTVISKSGIQESFAVHRLGPTKSNNHSVSLIIPCIKKHARYLPRLIQSVKKQTRPHDEILISLSSCDKIYGKKIADTLNRIIPVKVYSTSTPKAKAENINRIAKLAKGDILDIFDADDVMHPQRLEILLDTKKKLGVEAVMQASEKNPRRKFTRGKNNYDKIHNHYRYINGQEVFQSFLRNDGHKENTLELIPTKQKNWWPKEICCVSPIIVNKAKFLKENLYTDEIPGVLTKHTPGEDIVFIRRWINSCKDKSKCIAYVDTPLMKYFPSQSRGETHWK